ncbi:hypothetical protein B2J88_11840 [Rhodococcus sp. SRB_17]|uniref:hypothetical protein n=1 Tax=Acidovorax sp. SRB_24 TaxID=1962700 RepID=UPI00145DFF27|nr:hypothetical protein [Acidovorax sp. SRB_24]NMM75533.1 hypothetical protein [Acidovorax sp. SRB_24]NMM85052.1 hypothetical protein [Rhodococcus sp. SRB_17]
MNAKRTEPRVHCFQRPLHGGYVPQAGTTPEHLRAVFDAERDRLADAAKPRRTRRLPAAPATNPKQAQLQLVA